MNSDAKASIESLQGSSLPRLLFVSHSRGGGVARHIDDLAGAIESNAEVLLLQPHDRTFVSLRWLRSGRDLSLWFHAVDDWSGLLALLEAIGIDRVHFHHVDGLPPAVLELPSRLRCPHDLTLHDFYPACPAYHLTGSNGRYCGMEPDCGQCLDSQPAPWALTIDEWRRRFGGILASAARVIAPSNDAAQRIRAFFPAVSPVCWPHPEHEPSFPPGPLRVLVPGAMSTVKGLDVLEACVADAARRDLQLHFVVVGYLGRPLPQWPHGPLTVTGEYPDRMLPQLIAQQRGDVVFFPTQCPETFSYTLSVALDSGLPIVASNLGALPERLAGLDRARVVPWHASPSEMNDALVSTAVARPAPPARGPRMTFEIYRKVYLAGLTTGHRGSQPVRAMLDSRWLREPPRTRAKHPLAFLFQDGIDCGRAASREQLRRYAFDPDSMHADADARFMDLIHALGEQRAEAAASLAEKEAEARKAAALASAAQTRLVEIEASTSWRLTAPLRGLMRWLRATR